MPSDVASEPPPPPRDTVEPVGDCSTLAARAKRLPSGDDQVLLPILCPGLNLDHSQTRTVVLALASGRQAAQAIAALDGDPELQGVVRLAALDRASQPMPSELPDPSTALLTPIDDRVLAAVELAYAQLRNPAIEENQRTRAHALLAQVYIQALQSLGLRAGRPLPPFARLLAGPALFHGRSFCRFYWQRRVAGLERTFAETEVDLLALLIDLENTQHAGDPGLLAVERQRTLNYLENSGPTSRIARRAQRRPEARALGTDLLLPLVHELGRLIDHGFIDLALDRGLRAGAEAGGYGLDPVVALLTEELRQRDLREYERRLARRVERARKSTPRARHKANRELEGELPLEWPNAAAVADQARAWLAVAHGRGPDFARRHAIARALLSLRNRPDGVRELLTMAAKDAVVRAHRGMLLELLEARDDGSLASLRLSAGPETLPSEGLSGAALEDWARKNYALASRNALLHPR